MEAYNRTAHELPSLELCDFVAIQNHRSKRWDRTGTVVEVLANRQYRIRVDGSGRVALRNRRFLKKLVSASPQLIPAADTPDATPAPNVSQDKLTAGKSSDQKSNATTRYQDGNVHNQVRLNPQAVPFSTPDTTNTADVPWVAPSTKSTRAISRLAPFNKPGLTELDPPTRSRRQRGGDRGDVGAE